MVAPHHPDEPQRNRQQHHKRPSPGAEDPRQCQVDGQQAQQKSKPRVSEKGSLLLDKSRQFPADVETACDFRQYLAFEQPYDLGLMLRVLGGQIAGHGDDGRAVLAPDRCEASGRPDRGDGTQRHPLPRRGAEQGAFGIVGGQPGFGVCHQHRRGARTGWKAGGLDARQSGPEFLPQGLGGQTQRLAAGIEREGQFGAVVG